MEDHEGLSGRHGLGHRPHVVDHVAGVQHRWVGIGAGDLQGGAHTGEAGQVVRPHTGQEPAGPGFVTGVDRRAIEAGPAGDRRHLQGRQRAEPASHGALEPHGRGRIAGLKRRVV